MDVFGLRDQLVRDYAAYVRSFLTVHDAGIRSYLEQELEQGLLWPDPLIQLNPSFKWGPTIDELAQRGELHPLAADIFCLKDEQGHRSPMRLYQHQYEALRAANARDNYVLTTGTGSGKSLAYIVPIVNHVLKRGSGRGVQAIIVYPMNALANSQIGELEKFLGLGFDSPPVTFKRYTGQEKDEEREEIIQHPPDILLTNYVMLELILTRSRERQLVHSLRDLSFLVLDELHTYRGRQGADVALLVRRVREYCGGPGMLCVGTSATLASGGSHTEQQRAVAELATRLFGSMVSPERVIGETLARETAELPAEGLSQQLASCITSDVPGDYEAFRHYPLVAWLESTIGLTQEASGRLRRAVPRSITGPDGVAAELAALTGRSKDQCAQAIMRCLMAGYGIQKPVDGNPIFAFRVNQFLSRGDTVFASLEDPDRRFLSTSGQQFVPGDRQRVLLPLAFCRECGYEFFTVGRTTDQESSQRVFRARDFSDWLPERDVEKGYLFRSPSALWSDPDPDWSALVPEDWLEETNQGERRLKSSNRRHLPERVHIDTAGAEQPDGSLWHFVRGNFRFCPHCGVSYRGRQSDYAKLATLAIGGRSSATTILTLSTLRAMRDMDDLPPVARKLLSFTDNRQDAALQAGHLNDFVQVGLMRGALYHAVSEAEDKGLDHGSLPKAVFEALDIEFAEYASNSELKFRAREDTKQALRDVLGYRLYHDLRRGWRVTTPNLEQCGLLWVDYVSLDELVRDETSWQGTHPALVEATPETRERICRTLLDMLRRALAIDVSYLEGSEQDRIRRNSNQRLIGPWPIDEQEKLEASSVAFPRPRHESQSDGNFFVSSRGGFGQYLRRASTFPNYSGTLRMVDTDDIIKQLFSVLPKAGLLEVVYEPSDAQEAKGYQVPAAAMVWKRGDGTAYHDPLRVTLSGENEAGSSNAFFSDFYRLVALTLTGLHAADHTAQVSGEIRQEREDAFRTAELPILYCSPTMELGIDISQLNVVNMRNVPPTPANYAQRSGRAGRSGQPALVFTYCTSGSAHDQYYFKHQQMMVSGSVSPPRIDLANEDLVLAHVDAVWLTETSAPLKRSVSELLDLNQDDLPLDPDLKTQMQGQEAIRRARWRLNRIFAAMASDLAGADWYDDGWLDRQLDTVVERFDRACDRWRGLYRSAQFQAAEQSRFSTDPTRNAMERNRAKNLYLQAKRQLDLLMASEGALFQSDFYSYRYFASEGFLPGYSFPRLPLSAFVPGRRTRNDDDEFISRPRFLAISEFGPRSIIYHDGARYVVNQVIMPVSDTTQSDDGARGQLTQAAKLCPACGYLHPLERAGEGPDRCEYCHALLEIPMPNLFRMQNVSTVRRERINCDEEERMRMGYDLISCLRFGQYEGRVARRQSLLKTEAGQVLFEMDYGPAATIWRINKGWRNRTDEEDTGFDLDIERGYWAKRPDEDSDDPLSDRIRKVVPFVQDHRNSLMLKPSGQLSLVEMASLQAALKRAIQVLYQIEDSELAAEPLPTVKDRRYLLLYESAEGGAGVLRQLVDDSGALAAVARQALELCHMDPKTGAEVKHVIRGDETCEAACYDCLMSYYNQPDHPYLDRHIIRDTLLKMTHSVSYASPTAKPRGEHLQDLAVVCDTQLERDWLGFVDEQMLRLPDAAQVSIEGLYVQPDFIYREQRVAIFIDGPVHEEARATQRDADVDERLLDAGWSVIRFGYERDPWPQICQRHRHIFGLP